MAELKPCPFCGYPAYIHYDDFTSFVKCSACGAMTEKHNYNERGDIKQIAINEWNRRANG